MKLRSSRDACTTAIADPIEDISRRSLLVVPLAAALFAACRSDSDDDQRAVTPANPAYPRDVEDLFGTTTISTKPARIACLDPLGSLEALLSLGIAPVQIGVRSFTAQWLNGDPLALWPWLETRLAELGGRPERVSADRTPADPEMVLRSNPDLIVGYDAWIKEVRSRLAGIAPVLTLSGDTRRNIRILAAALDMEAEAETAITAFDARQKELLGGRLPRPAKVAILRYNGQGTFFAFTQPGYGPVDLSREAGFTPLPDDGTQPTTGISIEYSLERVREFAAADVVIMLGFSPEPTGQFLAMSTVRALPAVAAGRVVTVEQGPVAQAMASVSPLNLETCTGPVLEAAALVRG